LEFKKKGAVQRKSQLKMEGAVRVKIPSFIEKLTASVKQTPFHAAILTEHGLLNLALCGQAVGTTRNSVKCP
jgi:hypothetical protein